MASGHGGVHLHRRGMWLALGILIALTAGWIAGWPPAITAVDLEQGRLNTALPAPQAGEQLAQTFTPIHDGLSALEVTLVHYRPGEPAPPAPAALRLQDGAGRLVAERRLDNTTAAHNQVVRLTFPPEERSAGRLYTLSLTGSDGNALALWGYALDVLPDGELNFAPAGSSDLSGDLTLTTFYTFRWRTAPAVLITLLGRLGAGLLGGLLLVPLPGALLLAWLRPGWPRPVRWGAAWALGAAGWPLLWLWWGLLGGRWAGWGLWLLAAAGWGIVWWRGRNGNGRRREGGGESIALIAFLFLVLALRLLAVRDAAVLPWVDASRHALITAVMVDDGQLLTTYEPYLPVSRSPYHTGFHTLAAGLQLMLGELAPLEDLLLGLMQLLSTAVCLTLYAGGYLLTGRRTAGWLAAFLAALPLLFPAYYTTWGRLTQLTGLLILPVLLGLTWRLTEIARRRPDRPQTAAAWLTAALGAGLFLVHARVFIFYAPFALLAGLRGWLGSKRGIHLPPRPLAAAPLLLLALATPRLWRLWQERPDFYLPDLQPLSPTYNEFPTGYLTTGWEIPLWIATGAALLLALLLFLFAQLRRHPTRPEQAVHASGLLALWMGLLFLLTMGENLAAGWPVLLPQVNANSMFITLCIPQALLLGGMGSTALARLRRGAPLVYLLALLALGGWLGAATLFGAREQVGILNESTLLARPADLPALHWLKENTPPEARIAHSAWNWLLASWAGSDGGAWITPLTGRLSSTPPVDYMYSPDLVRQVDSFNVAAMAVNDWSTAAAAELLREYRFTHVYAGARGGFLDPAELMRNPQLALVYREGPVFVFRVESPES